MNLAIDKKRILRAFERARVFAICKRYQLDRNALRFTVQTLKPLPAQPNPARRRLVFFAHYDPQDEVDDYVVFYLESLYRLGSTIVFVSGSPRLKPEAAARAAPFCAAIFTRRTLSLDFGSWHLAWQHVQKAGWQLQDFDQFLLANDSVYGPLFDLTEMFSTFHDADMYGVTENKEDRAPHLQSYFLLWDLNQRTRPFLEGFWRDFLYTPDKQKLIDRCEIGISTSAREQGLKLKPYIAHDAFRGRDLEAEGHEHGARVRGRDVNNTLWLWDLLISELRCPFLKTEVPRRNRYGSAKVQGLTTLLRGWCDYDVTLIENNLRRLGMAAPPRRDGG